MTAARDADPEREDLGRHLLRLIEETHRDVRLLVSMCADLYNFVFFDLIPKQPAVPPNPEAVKAPRRPASSEVVREAADVVRALGGLFGRAGGRGR